MLTIYGVTVLTFMMLMYALERRHRFFVLAFAVGAGTNPETARGVTYRAAISR